jgi:hypothetical protein
MRKQGMPARGVPRGGSRIKKVATSRAAKDLKKVAKVAAPIGAGAAALKKANDNMKADLRRMEQLRKQYDKSAAKGSMSFNEYVRKYGKK